MTAEPQAPGGEQGAAPDGAPPPCGEERAGEEEARHNSEALDRLLAECRVLLTQATPLAKDFVRLLRTQGELTAFLAREHVRLAVARQITALLALVAFVAAWVFFCMALWQLAIDLTNQPVAGPLVLLLMHGLVGAALLGWRGRLRL
ncbi:MAG: hypothetical protein PWP23_1422 [Candidatus Sumerlaeota bacterium]|nr:hypothetical protein [Candidatus Sumerlaeota bacterium]